MKGITAQIILFYSKYKSKLTSIFFWYFAISFLIDRVINYFIHFPFFVGAALLMFPILFITTIYENKNKRQIYLLIFSFIFITISNSIVFLFGVKNISDLLFIILFICIYYYYEANFNSLKTSTIYRFLILILFLFSFTFINIDSASIKKTEYKKSLSWINRYDEKPEKKSNDKESVNYEKDSSVIPIGTDSIQAINQQKQIENNSTLERKSNPLDAIEGLRIYHNGLFRIPHVASYFFGFLALFFAYQYQKKKKILDIILLLLSLGICIYSGSRAILAAFVLSFIIFLFKKKYAVYLALLFGIALSLILANDYLLQLSKDTVFYQYFSFIKTSTQNFSNLSRVRLWLSWWHEVKQFGLVELIIGKSYMHALNANAQNLNFKVWFHNDFLNIFYTFGVWCTILYIWFFAKIYRNNKVYIKQNIFISIFYSSMIITALINGFYYYFPIFLLYPFFLMIKNEKQLA